jgi:4'-phosphopantetheinyl transferase
MLRRDRAASGATSALPGPDGLDREIHVWHGKLTASSDEIDRAGRLLTSAERERASRYARSNLADAFVLARAGLRAVLARYVGVAPGRLCFEVGEAGKPRLLFPPSPVEFNVSHSGDIAAYAVARQVSVGVDVEQIRPVPDAACLAARFFCTAERVELASLSAAHQQVAFIDCWVRKEAYVKAVGLGFSLPLDSFRVSLLPDAPPVVQPPRDGPGAEGPWFLHAYRPAPGYAGAVAWRSGPRSLLVLPVMSASALLAGPHIG